ncbi:MAG: hypothetical protein R3D26_10765 [Cyanobacteriota/Melainabacteria group bacterium]
MFLSGAAPSRQLITGALFEAELSYYRCDGWMILELSQNLAFVFARYKLGLFNLSELRVVRDMFHPVAVNAVEVVVDRFLRPSVLSSSVRVAGASSLTLSRSSFIAVISGSAGLCQPSVRQSPGGDLLLDRFHFRFHHHFHHLNLGRLLAVLGRVGGMFAACAGAVGLAGRAAFIVSGCPCRPRA